MTYRAHGKILLTGEYAVLHGALALALPTRPGQTLRVEEGPEPGRLRWRGLSAEGRGWLEADWCTDTLTPVEGASRESADPAVERLTRLLRACRAANPDFLRGPGGWTAETRLEFPRHWGLGSSSTLVHLLGQWAGVDPFPLQFAVFGGSGYDVACAGADGPLFYKLVDGRPAWEPVPFDPPFADRLFFVPLEAKRDSREAMADVRPALDAAMAGPQGDAWRNTLVHVTMSIRFATAPEDFAMHLRKHEDVVGALTGQLPVQQRRFPDFPGMVKSLGGWGGDLVLAVPVGATADEARAYFAERGLTNFVPWTDLILPPPR